MNTNEFVTDCCSAHADKQIPIYAWDCEWGERETQYYLRICNLCGHPTRLIKLEESKSR